MTKLYCFDLDGTLANIEHRLHYIQPSGEANYKKNWDEFFKASVDDAPIEWMINLYELVRNDIGGEILILTGRSEAIGRETDRWLIEHYIYYDYLIMRPENDHRPDDILKPKLLEDFLRDKDFQVQFIVEDREKVCRAYLQRGYNVLQVVKTGGNNF